MSGDPPISDLQVFGGAGSTSADLVDLQVLATTGQDLAGQLGEVARAAHGVLADPDWLAAAVLAPGGAARATTTLLTALDGPDGLSWLATSMGARAAAVHLVVAGYDAADAAQSAAMDLWNWFEGASGLWIAEAAGSALADVDLDVDVGWEGWAPTLDVSVDFDWERWITDHPEVAADAINSVPGALSTLTVGLGLVAPSLAATVLAWFGPAAFVSPQATMGRLASLFPDGSGFTATPVIPSRTNALVEDLDREPPPPPTGVSDLLDALIWRDGQASTTQDLVEVQTITAADGSHSFVVTIPGTREFALTPGEASDQPNDMATNLHAVAGETTQRELAIAAALRDAMEAAGADADSEVMLVGHSQGGIVAAQAAADSVDGGSFEDFNVTSVLTAGAPVSLADIPPDVQVLALENDNDVVPDTDGADNPVAPNVTTVTFDHQTGTMGGNHGLTGGYSQAADAVDASSDPSLEAYLDGAAPFLEGTSVSATVYELDRIP